MQIGIGLPGMIPGTKGEQIVEWARRADAGPFSSLASLDRLVYRNYEALIVLAAAAAVTQRVRLMTTVLIAGLFPVEAQASPETTFSFIHILAILGAFLSLTLAAVGLSWRFRREERWRSSYRFSLALALLMAAASIGLIPAFVSGIHPEFYGIGLRLLTFSGLIWLFLVAIRLRFNVDRPVSGG